MKWFYGICAVLFIAVIVIFVSFPYWNKQVYTVTSVSVVLDNGKTLYALETDSGKKIVCENEDMFFICKFNSSDFAVTLKDIEKNPRVVEITVSGYRIPLFSSYPNIQKIGGAK